jgi:small subunit ribosomal protein S4
MGDPKYPRRDWKKPKRPLNYDLKMEELKTLGTFGLKTKRELWKAHTKLSRLRHQARSLLALREEVRKKKEPLNLQVTDLLSRRLQTVVHKKLGFKTPYQARQAVTHGHVMIGDRRVSVPSYTVLIKEEKEIHLSSDSSLSKLLEKTQKQDIENAPTEEPIVENAVEQPKVENAVEQPKVENASQNPEVENSATKPSED